MIRVIRGFSLSVSRQMQDLGGDIIDLRQDLVLKIGMISDKRIGRGDASYWRV